VLETYENVEIEWIAGREAVLTIYQGAEMLEEISLYAIQTREEMHSLMKEKGFKNKKPKVKEVIKFKSLEDMKKPKGIDRKEEIKRQDVEGGELRPVKEKIAKVLKKTASIIFPQEREEHFLTLLTNGDMSL